MTAAVVNLTTTQGPSNFRHLNLNQFGVGCAELEYKEILCDKIGTFVLMEVSKMNPRLPTKEELELIRASILIPIMMDITQKNIDEMHRQSITLKPLFIRAGEKLLDTLTKRVSEVRKQLRQSQIKVWESRHGGHTVYYKYLCRGYEEEFGIIREVMKAEISIQLADYMRKVFD
jgi:hypothetical protein